MRSRIGAFQLSHASDTEGGGDTVVGKCAVSLGEEIQGKKGTVHRHTLRYIETFLGEKRGCGETSHQRIYTLHSKIFGECDRFCSHHPCVDVWGLKTLVLSFRSCGCPVECAVHQSPLGDLPAQDGVYDKTLLVSKLLQWRHEFNCKVAAAADATSAAATRETLERPRLLWWYLECVKLLIDDFSIRRSIEGAATEYRAAWIYCERQKWRIPYV